MTEGLFEIARLATRPAQGADRIILVCRDGKLFGADARGRVYTGVLHARSVDPEQTSNLDTVFESPFATRPPLGFENFGAGVPISAKIDTSAHHQNATVLIGGKPVAIEITYLGPLPQ